MTAALAIALDYIKRGWSPLPVHYKSKKPTLSDWQNLRIKQDTAARYFNGAPLNVGGILGPASGGLTDIDLDCDEAVAIGPYMLPTTEAEFGRASRRSSHWLYITSLGNTLEKATIEYHDPRDQKMLVELRIGGGGKGAQTVLPGSVHESGEEIVWEKQGEPAAVDGGNLRRS